jgi:hypothetical protein
LRRAASIAELAWRYGITDQHVRYLIRGPRSPNPPKPGVPGGRWTAAEDKLVRTLSVADAVAKTGRSLHAVVARRRLLGVTTNRRWIPAEDELFLHHSLEEIARRTGRSLWAVRWRWGVLLWGKAPRKRAKD